jgi:hypothetical protein
MTAIRVNWRPSAIMLPQRRHADEAGNVYAYDAMQCEVRVIHYDRVALHAAIYPRWAAKPAQPLPDPPRRWDE